MPIEVIRGGAETTTGELVLSEVVPLRRAERIEYMRECRLNAGATFADCEIEFDSELVVVVSGTAIMCIDEHHVRASARDLVELSGVERYTVSANGEPVVFIQVGVSTVHSAEGR